MRNRNACKHNTFVSLCCYCALLGSVHSQGAEELEEIVVYSELRDTRLLRLSNSITVLDERAINASGAQHLEQLLASAPNVNYSSGASRGRFFQIRGIGERSQFVDPVNPSVGLVIDGLEFTGLGLSASTLDIERIEILRGPQGTQFGANALAGMIYMQSGAPTERFSGKLSAELSNYNGHSVDAMVSGPLGSMVAYRLAARTQRSDGYIDNEHLGIDNSSNIDEQQVRARLQIDPRDGLELGLVGFYANIDNGYDDFSLANNRTTGSDQPGRDQQESSALGLNAQWSVSDRISLRASINTVAANTDYGYDEDWSFVNAFPASFFPYSSADRYERERDILGADIRALSTGTSQFTWVAGLYLRSEDEELLRQRLADLQPSSSFSSKFDTRNSALYAQLGLQINDALRLISGLRVERREADYEDSRGVRESVSDTLWGGKLALEFTPSDSSLLYALLARGYKAGGVNAGLAAATQQNTSIDPALVFFGDEALWNIELGARGRWLSGRLALQLALFFQDRDDLQAKQSIFNPEDFSFVDYLANGTGSSTGAELQFAYTAQPNLDVFGSVGILESEFGDFFALSHVDARDDFTGTPLAPVNLDGRDVGHAPNYQFQLGFEFRTLEQFFVRADVSGKDEFFFSNSHDQRSARQTVLNAQFGYRGEKLDLTLWGRNLLDEDVEVRGFYFSNQFGNNPGNGYAPETYVQLGEPLTFGIRAQLRF